MFIVLLTGLCFRNVIQHSYVQLRLFSLQMFYVFGMYSRVVLRTHTFSETKLIRFYIVYLNPFVCIMFYLILYTDALYQVKQCYVHIIQPFRNLRWTTIYYIPDETMCVVCLLLAQNIFIRQIMCIIAYVYNLDISLVWCYTDS